MTARPVAVIAGASGFVGTALRDAFVQDGYAIRTIGRAASVDWSSHDAIRDAVDGAEILVNLAGKSVNCRYTERNRDEILRSRVETTRLLRTAVAHAPQPPRLWLNASTATIYRHEMHDPHTEADGRLGEGFSIDVARAWEQEFFADDLPHTRRVALRMAIVLGDGPATNLLVRLAHLGLGGPQIDGWWPLAHRRYRGIGPQPTGDGRPAIHRTHGRQKFSWIHLDDVVGAVRFIRDHDDLAGPVNLASPRPSDNATLMRTLRDIVGMPVGLPAWRWMLEPAMWALRTEPELVLKSRWVLPGVLEAAGYSFAHPELEAALRDVIRRSA
jgi:NAD dependent epimerase/dehydratase family enzyme